MMNALPAQALPLCAGGTNDEVRLHIIEWKLHSNTENFRTLVQDCHAVKGHLSLLKVSIAETDYYPYPADINQLTSRGTAFLKKNYQ